MSTSKIEENNLIELDIIKKELYIGECKLRFEKDLEIDEKWKLKAKETLGETQEVMERTKEELIKLIQDEKGLNFPIDNDYQIFRYLRLYCYDPVKAFKSIQRHFQFRLRNPHLSKDLLPTLVCEPFYQNILIILPGRDQEGRRIMYIRVGKNWCTSQCTLAEILRGIMLSGEGVGYEPVSQINGSVVICDMDGFSFDKIFALSPSIAKNIVDYLQNASGVDIKEFHFINQPFIFGAAFGLFKPFIHERFRDRIHFHGNMKGGGKKSLLKHLHAAHLPVWLGGELNYPKEYGPQIKEFSCLYMDLYEENCTWGYKMDEE